jgi:hypothetical protein
MKGVNFITDDKNRKKAVVISLKTIEARQQELEDLLGSVIAEAHKDEPKKDWKDVKAAFKKKGKL